MHPLETLKTKRRKLHWELLALLAVTFAIYSQTIKIPWYFDDYPAIVNNSSLRDLNVTFSSVLIPRGLVNLTFAINFRLHGLEMAGYHVVNIAIHLANGVLLYHLLQRVFKNDLFPRVVVLAIFLLHPVQTQAVNYVVQRYTLSSAFFGLLSILLMAKWVEDNGFPFQSFRVVVTYLAALLSSFSSVLCKQNTATLFLVIPIFLVMFTTRKWPKKKMLLYILPFTLLPLWEVLSQVLFPLFSGLSMEEIAGIKVPPGGSSVSPFMYFVTEWKVLLVYLRLLILPYGQALDYGFPLATSLLTLGNLTALAVLFISISAGWLVRRKMPIISFGITWYFLFLLVESSVIPLDPLVEHRLYLPIVGFSVVVAEGLARFSARKIAMSSAIIIILVFSAMTLQRNTLWLSPAALLLDNVNKYPDNARVYAGAANALVESGQLNSGKMLLERGFQRGLHHEAMFISLMNIHILNGSILDAISVGEQGIVQYPWSTDLLSLLGGAETSRLNHSRAEQYFQKAIALFPEREQGYNNLGSSFEKQGRVEEAIEAYRKALWINPLYAIAHYNLGMLLFKENKISEAEGEFRKAYSLGDDARFLYMLVVITANAGDTGTAMMLLEELSVKSPSLAVTLRTQLSKK